MASESATLDVGQNIIKIGKIILIIVGIIILIILLWNAYKWFKKQQNELLFANSTATTTVAGTPVSINLGTTAQKINSAFHDYYWGLAEDEETAIIALLGVPKNLVPQLSSVYFQAYDLNLNDEFLKYLSSSDYERVAQQFN